MAVAIYQTLAVVVDQRRAVGRHMVRVISYFWLTPVKIELIQPVPQQRRHGRIVSHGEHLPYEGIGKKLSPLYCSNGAPDSNPLSTESLLDQTRQRGLLLLIPPIIPIIATEYTDITVIYAKRYFVPKSECFPKCTVKGIASCKESKRAIKQ